MASRYPEAVLVDQLLDGSVVAQCSGAVIAPRVVLTAGQCVDGGFDDWEVASPYAHQRATAKDKATFDWDTRVDWPHGNARWHDIALLFLSSDIALLEYPRIAAAQVADGTAVFQIGRVDGGLPSSTDLFASNVRVKSAEAVGYAYDYLTEAVLDGGDVGGPNLLPGDSPHSIVAVNSDDAYSARVDLVASWIADMLACVSAGNSVPSCTESSIPVGTETQPCAAKADGWYCGATEQFDAGAVGMRYECAGGVVDAAQACGLACQKMPPGTDDVCPCTGYADGWYCGASSQFAYGDPDTRYLCSGGSLTQIEPCSNGCQLSPPGVNDTCI